MFLIDGTPAPKALSVVLRQSGLRPTINSSPHIANHYMFVFNFITLLLLRYCCHIQCRPLSVVVVVQLVKCSKFIIFQLLAFEGYFFYYNLYL